MNAQTVRSSSSERVIRVMNGWVMLAICLLFAIGGLACFYCAAESVMDRVGIWIVLGIMCEFLFVLWCFGFFTLQPNEARVLILFGSYQGTVRESGFHWTNPFNRKLKLSLRARNFQSERLKVNDKRGNPIEIACVVVWRVADTAQAVFDVDAYAEYVRVQSESAVRHLASAFAYDHGEE